MKTQPIGKIFLISLVLITIAYTAKTQDFNCGTLSLLKNQEESKNTKFSSALRTAEVQEPTMASSHQYIEFKNLVVLYKETNTGTLHSEVESNIQEPLDHISNFYFRNTGLRILFKWEILIVEEYVGINNENNEWTNTTLLQTDLGSRGVTSGQYDCIVIFTPSCGNGSYGASSLFGTTGLIQLCWLGPHWVEGAGIHEYNHFIDDMFRLHGYPEYPFNHPGAARQKGEYIPAFGHLDAGIVRNISSDRWLSLATSQWGDLKTADDSDLDLVPDMDSNLPIHETLLQGS